MIKSESMTQNIKYRLNEAGLLDKIDFEALNIILSTVEELTSQPGHVCVEGEWSVVTPLMVQKVKEVLG